jgi:hypothetical protein
MGEVGNVLAKRRIGIRQDGRFGRGWFVIGHGGFHVYDGG